MHISLRVENGKSVLRGAFSCGECILNATKRVIATQNTCGTKKLVVALSIPYFAFVCAIQFTTELGKN